MKNKDTIRKLCDCAKGLLEVARELQSSERMEPPRTLEIVERQIRAKDGKAHAFRLPFVVGVDEFGDDVVLELARLPHVLIGGATGQGKTTCLNSLIAGLVAPRTPDEVRFVVYDPKCVEHTGLADLPHLIKPPVTSVEKMVEVLHWLESEVDNRLRMFASGSSTFHSTTHYRNAFKLLCRVTNRCRLLRLKMTVLQSPNDRPCRGRHDE